MFFGEAEKQTTFPPSRERSEREMQKTLLGLCPSLNYLVTRSLRSREESEQ
ncbi:MAG: hypothetical protein U5L45_24405 [Saprospiraceae bacterium]|nr:hypothetical protein [Saprospiraceae bacterium]